MSLKASMEQLLGEILRELRSQRATSTELAGQLRGLIANDLLLVEAATFDSTGIISRDFPANYGTVEVTNESAANVVTVSADPPQASAPQGRGAYRVGAGKSRVIGLHGRALTLYGTANDKVSFQVFTRTWPPGGGS